jgi:hypothetical protein
VQVAALGYARPSRGTFGQVVPLDDGDSLDVVAEGLGGREAGEAGAHDHGVRGQGRWVGVGGAGGSAVGHGFASLVGEADQGE